MIKKIDISNLWKDKWVKIWSIKIDVFNCKIYHFLFFIDQVKDIREYFFSLSADSYNKQPEMLRKKRWCVLVEFY